MREGDEEEGGREGFGREGGREDKGRGVNSRDDTVLPGDEEGWGEHERSRRASQDTEAPGTTATTERGGGREVRQVMGRGSGSV